VLEKAVGESRFQILLDLVRLNLPVNLKDAQKYAMEALEVSTELKDTLSIVKSTNAIGLVKKEMGFHLNAIQYFEAALKLARKKNYRPQAKFILNNLGRSYQRSANYAKALEYHLESLKMREEDYDTLSISVALNNIGVLYQDLGDYENAFSYYRKIYDLKTNTKRISDFELCLINLADVSNALGKYDDARQYITEAFKFCENNKDCDKRELALAHYSIGYSYLNSSDLVRAEQEFFISANLFTEAQSSDRVEGYHALALVRFKMGDYTEALNKLAIAQTLADETEIPKYQLIIYQLYGDIYSKLGDFKRAADYQKKFIELNQEIYDADLIKNIARVQAEHQEEQNLRTIAAQDQEILSREESLNLQRKQFLFLGIIAALVFVLAIVFYRNQKRQAKSNLALEKAKETIEEKNNELILSNAKLEKRVKERTKELNNSNEALKKVNEELDHFIYKTSHDIRGPLSSLKGITNLAIRDSRDETISEYLQKLDFTTDKLHKVLTRLQIINQINHTLLMPELVDINQIIEDIVAVEKKRGIPNNLKITTSIDKDIILFSDKAVLTLVMENLIDNAIKFYDASDRKNPFVKIIIQENERGVTIKVVDNGIGIKSIPRDQIFKMFVRASERSESGGIGLYLTKISTEKIGGTIEMNMSPESYTEFIVKLPPDLRAVIKMREEAERKMEVEKMRLAQIQLEESQQVSNTRK
jgi:signal transduction histidine kinase